jgi:hypothetical protein
MHFIWRCLFLNCSVQRPVWMGGGGRAIKFLMHLSSPNRAIKFLYAPEQPEQGTFSPTPYSMGPGNSLLGSSPPWSFSG